jgi:hypothetical protein
MECTNDCVVRVSYELPSETKPFYDSIDVDWDTVVEVLQTNMSEFQASGDFCDMVEHYKNQMIVSPLYAGAFDVEWLVRKVFGCGVSSWLMHIEAGEDKQQNVENAFKEMTTFVATLGYPVHGIVATTE